jgi:hypothetical protein
MNERSTFTTTGRAHTYGVQSNNYLPGFRSYDLTPLSLDQSGAVLSCKICLKRNNGRPIVRDQRFQKAEKPKNPNPMKCGYEDGSEGLGPSLFKGSLISPHQGRRSTVIRSALCLPRTCRSSPLLENQALHRHSCSPIPEFRF